MTKELTVGLGERSYPIRIGGGVREEAPGCELLVTDSTVDALYGAWGEKKIGPKVKFVFPAGEQSKKPETVIELCRRAAETGLDRHCRFAALGGGVTGDMTGFAAAIYLRGVDFIQLPTTLLAMVDSSVGGKTGADLPEGKNLIGAFHQPRQVLIDTDFLKTLPERELCCGAAEIVKTAVIADAVLFAELESSPETLTRKPDWSRFPEIIRRSCEIKSAVVAADEREAGCRALLNYGHTFGHAFELLSRFAISHGEGVALGMCAAGNYALRAGFWSGDALDRQTRLLKALGLPVRLRERFSGEAVLEIMHRDKKSSGGRINLVLPEKIGAASAVKNADEKMIVQAVEALYD